MLNKILDKLFGFFWLKDLVDWLNGKKTLLGIIAFILSACILVIPQQFPELIVVAEWATRIAEFLKNIGVDLETLNGIAAGLAGFGLAHKAVKNGKGTKSKKA